MAKTPQATRTAQADPIPPAPPATNDLVEVIMTVSLSGIDFAVGPGDPHQCSPAEAQRLRDAGFAEPEAA